jgi:hypothetical protein
MIKRNLGVGEAVVIVPHQMGVKTLKLKFQILPPLKREEMPLPQPKTVLGLGAIAKAGTSEQSPAIATDIPTIEKPETKEAI